MRQQWNDKRLAYKERLQGQLAGNNYDLIIIIQIQNIHVNAKDIYKYERYTIIHKKAKDK